MEEFHVAVVIPCYRVTDHILTVLSRIGDQVTSIVAVDDACPDGSGKYIQEHCRDPRLTVLFHAQNKGVGGAVMTGYRYAADAGATVMVKVDGDGQMDPALIRHFVRPILDGEADYTKGNRFYNIEDVRSMPLPRLVGNAALSFMTKFSSGYWNIFDPTNGYTAISAAVFLKLPDKIKSRYFFESDLLFRLGTLRAVVCDVPMSAVYSDEESNLRIGRVLSEFLVGHCVNTFKRLLYCYFLRDFSIASVELVAGLAFIAFGSAFGVHAWGASISSGVAASTGTVMLSALPLILGVQFLLSFLAFDIAATPSRTIHRALADDPKALPQTAAQAGLIT